MSRNAWIVTAASLLVAAAFGCARESRLPTSTAPIRDADLLAGNPAPFEPEAGAPLSAVVHTTRWLRQGRSGMFERGVPPPPNTGSDPAALERTLLRYPLHRGARWVVSSVPLVTAQAERMETIESPAGRFKAWRIGIHNTSHQGEAAHAWYGRAGYLGMTSHPVAGAGSELMITTDQAQWLTSIDLVHRRPLAPIEEAKEALGAVAAGEQVYFQKPPGGTFTDAADAAEIRVKLGVSLDAANQRWAFSVREASTTGFVAEARGRAGSKAAGLIVTLRYVRGQPAVWEVQKRRRSASATRCPG